MTDELKPCPFCGGKARVEDDQNPTIRFVPDYYWVLCMKCGAASEYMKREKAAIKRWNRRAIKALSTEPVAWLINYTYQGKHCRAVSMRNAIAEYRDYFDPDATVTPLYALEAQ